MTYKISPWLKFEIAEAFFNKLNAHYKYPVPDFKNLPFPIQMQFSEKRKTFPQFFVPFMESTSNFKNFQKEEDRHS